MVNSYGNLRGASRCTCDRVIASVQQYHRYAYHLLIYKSRVTQLTNTYLRIYVLCIFKLKTELFAS